MDWKKPREKINETVTAIAAGMGIKDVREMLRGEPPSKRPNPRFRVHTTSFWFHIRPRWYPKSATRFTYTLGLGWISVFLLIIEGITGLILMIPYTPSPDRAYFDMLNIMGGIPFGDLLRDIHRLAAEGMVISVVLHAARVFVTASYKRPRTFNWVIGMLAGIVTLIFSYSGYLLTWDQIAYWAITIGSSMAETVPLIGSQLILLLRGAPEVGAAGLLRFYTAHVVILPIAIVCLLGVHYYKVVRQGFSKPPALEEELKGEKEERVPFLPNILIREALWAVIGIFILVVVAAFLWNGPLEDHANPYVTPLHATAPWYFLWVQGLIKLPNIFGPVEGKLVWGVVVPALVFGVLFALPYIDRNPRRRWQDRKLLLGIGGLFAVALVILTYMGTPSYGLGTPPAEAIIVEFVPGDREGRIHELPYEALIDGTYDTSTFTASSPASSLEEFLAALKARIESEEGLPDGRAELTIHVWQRDLKKVDLTVSWTEEGQTVSRAEDVYIHREAR